MATEAATGSGALFGIAAACDSRCILWRAAVCLGSSCLACRKCERLSRKPMERKRQPEALVQPERAVPTGARRRRTPEEMLAALQERQPWLRSWVPWGWAVPRVARDVHGPVQPLPSPAVCSWPLRQVGDWPPPLRGERTRIPTAERADGRRCHARCDDARRAAGFLEDDTGRVFHIPREIVAPVAAAVRRRQRVIAGNQRAIATLGGHYWQVRLLSRAYKLPDNSNSPNAIRWPE